MLFQWTLLYLAFYACKQEGSRWSGSLRKKLKLHLLHWNLLFFILLLLQRFWELPIFLIERALTFSFVYWDCSTNLQECFPGMYRVLGLPHQNFGVYRFYISFITKVGHAIQILQGFLLYTYVFILRFEAPLIYTCVFALWKQYCFDISLICARSFPYLIQLRKPERGMAFSLYVHMLYTGVFLERKYCVGDIRHRQWWCWLSCCRFISAIVGLAFTDK